MAKPEQPKDIKPKTEGEGAEAKVKKPVDENMKVIVINLVTTVLICLLFLSVNYILQANLLSSKLASMQPAGGEAAAATDASAGEEDTSEVQKGIVVDLGDFILNLSDVSPRKYLKVNVALEVSSKPEDEAPAGGKKEGGEGEGKGPAVSPVDAEMAQFKPALRDAVINTLSSKTSAELQTTPGKELAKDQITEAVNSLFAGDREVLRVSFGDFIIQ